MYPNKQKFKGGFGCTRYSRRNDTKMQGKETMSDKVNEEISYLDLQALAGISKHDGGFPATRELLAMCHIEDAKEVLEVGCGIGVGAAYMARTHGVRVVAVDLSEKMLDWARQRAQREGVADQDEQPGEEYHEERCLCCVHGDLHKTRLGHSSCTC